MLSPSYETTDNPKLFELLATADQVAYTTLRNQISKESAEISFFRFGQLLDLIKEFCQRGNDEDSLRSYICGICWLNNSVAINYHQFKFLIPFLRSTSQNLLRKLGYMSAKPSQNLIQSLTKKVPNISNEPHEQRSWHFYTSTAVTPKPCIDCTINMQEEAASSPEPPEINPKIVFLGEKEPIVKAEAEDIYSFFDDPFLLPPLFLVEDSVREEDAVQI